MTDTAPTARPALSRPEFIALMAMMFATVAFSIDSMLPALPEIAEDMSPDAPNRAQLVLTTFVFGMGLGTLFVGPLSDAVGRKITITCGFTLYSAAAVLAIMATSLETLLAARLVQGLGAAGPRVVTLAMVRDLYEGRRMAQIMSFVMMVFVMVPAIAPFFGSVLIDAFGWPAIYVAFVIFALIGGTWMNLRQPETLPPERRIPITPERLRAGLVEVLTHRGVLLYIAVLTCGFAQMFGLLASIQPIYDETYGRAESFPLWFMVGGLLSMASTILNATLVMRLGMRRLALVAYGAQSLLAGALAIWALAGGPIPFGLFFVWSVTVFFMAGLTFGNLNALALQPMGHIAGMASSVVGAVSTMAAAVIGAPIGLAFDGTPVPLIAATAVFSTLAFLLMRRATEARPADAKSYR